MHEKTIKKKSDFSFLKEIYTDKFDKKLKELFLFSSPRVILSTLIILIIVGFIGKLSFNSSKIMPIIESATIAKSS